MACNAWNHPSNCQCGWGGDTGGSGVGGGSRFKATPVRQPVAARPILAANAGSRTATFQTFTIPNAKCPVCGAAVFFYQSPFGGRVFFDELGPPWPKHPCTDNPRYRGPGVVVIPLTSPTPRYDLGWLKSDWLPLIYARSCLFGEGDDDPDVKTAFMGVFLGHSSGRRIGCMFTVRGALFVELNAPIYVRLDENGKLWRMSCLAARTRIDDYLPGDYDLEHIHCEAEL